MLTNRIVLAAVVLAAVALGTPLAAQWTPDLGDGRYRNPVLAGDYSDPDVVRVGRDFYLTSSSFTNAPGLPILHSRDLVNWTLIGHALPRVLPDAHFTTPRRGGGVWAPTIRFHAGRFMIYYPDPDFGIFMVGARDPKGPWSAPVLVDSTKGAIDPAPFWDDDGSAWLVHAFAASRAGRSNLIVLKRLNPAGTRTVDAGQTVIDGARLPAVRTSIGSRPWQTTEGPKLYKRGGYYYIFVPSGSVKGGWQGVFRARRITGPYEGRDVLDQGGTAVNGPHQGAWVTTAQGSDWFVHFQDTDSYGRRVHLQPMRWVEDWPVIGDDADGDGIGQPVETYTKPVAGAPVAVPAVDDDFAGPYHLGWQWNANPMADWTAPAAPGWLRLKSVSSSANLYESGHLLSQKLPGPAFTVTTKMRFAPLRVGERAGLAILGSDYAWIGAERGAAGPRIVQVVRRDADKSAGETVLPGPELATDATVQLRMTVEPVTVAEPPPGFTPYWPAMLRSTHARVRFAYSFDGLRFVELGDAFVSRPGRWVGAQMGLFAQAPTGTPSNIATSVGYAEFDWFRVRR